MATRGVDVQGNAIGDGWRRMTRARPPVVFRSDASLLIGTGHVMRCLTLADALCAYGYESHFICREHPGNLIAHIRNRGHFVHVLPPFIRETSDPPSNKPLSYDDWLGVSWETDALQSRDIIHQLNPAWLVVDHYSLDMRWEQVARPRAGRLLVLDDLADRPHDADLLLDQGLGRERNDYRRLVPAGCDLLIGPRYALLRPEFAMLRDESLRRRHSPQLRRILITMGGVDKDDATGTMLDLLSACGSIEGVELDVVMGRNSPWLDLVRDKAKRMPWPTHVTVDAPDMARRMVEADLAIGAAGSTSWERCALGLPTLMVVLAENQQRIAEALASVGACVLLGRIDEIGRLPWLCDECRDPSVLRGLSEASAAVADGRGAERLCHGMGLEP